MTIETKYNLRDTVHFIWEGNIKSLPIAKISFLASVDSHEHTIHYNFNIYVFGNKIAEEQLFSTKDEAAASWLHSQGLQIGIKQ